MGTSCWRAVSAAVRAKNWAGQVATGESAGNCATYRLRFALQFVERRPAAAVAG
jgi:hypothetical protein